VYQVLQQWITAARAPRGRSIDQAEEEEDDCPVVRKKPKMAADRPPKVVKQRPAVAATVRTKKSRARIESSDSSDSEPEAEKSVRYSSYLFFSSQNLVFKLNYCTNYRRFHSTLRLSFSFRSANLFRKSHLNLFFF
jgi:hypothetical protein